MTSAFEQHHLLGCYEKWRQQGWRVRGWKVRGWKVRSSGFCKDWQSLKQAGSRHVDSLLALSPPTQSGLTVKIAPICSCLGMTGCTTAPYGPHAFLFMDDWFYSSDLWSIKGTFPLNCLSKSLQKMALTWLSSTFNFLPWIEPTYMYTRLWHDSAGHTEPAPPPHMARYASMGERHW